MVVPTARSSILELRVEMKTGFGHDLVRVNVHEAAHCGQVVKELELSYR